ncbi:hypothetical protein KSP39_PZI011484 [Platanthera zijinensis]|uniref:Uncharacterized protein n=1 Tax=Platanthera zijinensis TaxID=2320716 RepID=A0AAP0G5V9_9ASPA
MEVDIHFIKDHLDKGNICTPFVSSFDQLADVFTKGLSSDNFKNNTDKGRDPHSHRQYPPEGWQKRKKTLDSCYSLRLIGGHQE